jgi:hypothetical protein
MIVNCLKAALSCVLALFFIVRAAHPAGYDPDLTWKSLKTDHFWIHYHQGLAAPARKLARIAEKVHARLSADIGWTPALRTDIILIDSTDWANGLATPYPFNKVLIYLSRPEPDSSLHNYDQWLESVFTHEYTHILNIDMAHGIPRWGRSFLGRNPLFYPNLYQPLWIIEGNAVYHESKDAPFGRNNSTYTDMVMRTEALSGSLKGIDRASHFPRDWPAGKVPYLYGGLFVKYLDDTYGEGSFARFQKKNSYNIVPFADNILPGPFLFNRAALSVYGKPFWGLWKEWQASLEATAFRQRDEIAKQGLTPMIHLSPADSSARFPRFSADGKRLYYIASSTRRGEHLNVHDIGSTSARKLCRVNNPSGLCAGDGNMIYVADSEYYRSFSLYSEAFIYDGTRYARATTRLRGKYIEKLSGGRYMYIARDEDRYSLMISQADLKRGRAIIADTPVQLSFCRPSPDGRKVVFAVKNGGPGTGLVVMDIEAETFLLITRNMNTDMAPAWHPGGDRIVFTSDRGGVHNLHEYDLKDHRIRRLTNVTGGLFYPDVSPDGAAIAAASYERNGFRIVLFDYPETPFDEIQAEPEVLDMTFFQAAQENPDGDAGPSRRYSPWPSSFPAFYIPLVASQEIFPGAYDFAMGVWVRGNDVLERHSYYLALYYYFIQRRLAVQANYTLSVLHPDISVGYFDETILCDKDDFPWKSRNDDPLRRELYRYGYCSNSHPFITYNSQHYLDFTYYLQQRFRDDYIPGRSVKHSEEVLGKMQASYSVYNARTHAYSISREEGRDFSVTADIYHACLGSDYTFYTLRADYREYLPGFYDNNVVILRIRGGACIDKKDERPYSLGRYNSGRLGATASGKDEMGIRGYAADRRLGNYLMAATAEFRFPLVQKDAGAATFPLMFRDFWLAAFFDCGNAFDRASQLRRFGYSAGAELNLRLTLGYNVDITTMVGYAYGFTTPGGHQVYFALSSFLEGAAGPRGENAAARKE